MLHLFLVMLGGAIGTLARYILIMFISFSVGSWFPFGTLCVNLLGSFLIGFLTELVVLKQISTHIRTIITVGLLGGFTTFSAFSFETVILLKQASVSWALLNVMAQTCGGVIAVVLGITLAKALL